MKILITTDWYVPVINGVVTSVINLYNELVEKGHDVRILTLQQTDHITVENTYYIKSLAANLLYPNARIIRSTARREINEIIEWGPDIIHSQCEFSTYYFVKKISRKLDIPIVHTYHTNYEDYVHYLHGSQRMNRKLVEWFSRKVLKDIDHVVVPTRKVEDLLRKYNTTKPISVIPSGVDMKRNQKEVDEDKMRLIRQRFNIPDDKLILLYLGRLGKEKNVEEILEYLKGTGSTDTSLMVVGDGPDRLRLKARAVSLGLENQVVFTGMVPSDQVNLYYRLADMFVSASTSETQGLTYIEALSNGLPVLCRKDPCLTGVVYDHVNGYLYEDFKSFESFLSMIEGNRTKLDSLAANALDYSQAYSSERFAASLESLYFKVVSDSRRGKLTG